MFGLLAGSLAWGDEPADRFLAALRERGYFDVALEYLEMMQSSPLISEDYRQVLPFERAETLIESTRTLRNLREMDDRLNQAHQLLVEYSARELSLEGAARVARYQGNLFFRRARISLSQAESDRLTVDERAVFQRQAREFLRQTRESLLTAQAHIRELIDPQSPRGIKIDPQDPASGELLKKYQRDFVRLRLDLARSMEELADTFEPNDPERLKFLKEAIEELSNLQTAYRNQPHASNEVWQARLREAACYQKLGKPQDALRMLNEVFELTSSAARPLKKTAFLIACESWNDLENYPASDIVALLEPVVNLLSRNEQRDPDWLRIQMELALAQYRLGESTREEGGARNRTQGETLKRMGGRLLRSIARIPSPHQETARYWLAEWNIPLREQREEEGNGLPQTFEDLRNKARDNISEMEVLSGEIRTKKNQLTNATPDQVDQLQLELEDLNEQLAELANLTLELVSFSAQWVDDETSAADRNYLRYLQSYSYFATEQFLEASLIGEFMLEKFPSVDWTKVAMNWVIQSKGALYRQAEEGDRDFELAGLLRVCRAVLERWPGSDEAGRAAVELISIKLPAGEFEESLALYQSIPDSFPAKSLLAIQLGQRLWAVYRGGDAAKLESLSVQDRQQQLQQIRQLLETGIQGAASTRLTYGTAVASHQLVEVYLEMGNWQLALTGLEGADVSPLDLVKQKNPVIFSHPAADSFVRETYRLALRVYLAALRDSKGLGNWVEKIRGVLSAMRQSLSDSNDPQQQAILSQTYSLIANELLKQFDDLESADDKRAFASDMKSFLNTIEKESTDSRIVLWAGSTALGVAQSLTDIGLVNEAKPLFEQAVAGLTRAEQLGFDKDPQQEAMMIELQRQRGLALRGNLDFEGALEQFVNILKQQPQNVRAQINAAETLQHWGVERKRARSLAEAIKGTHKWTNPQTRRESNLVWGWENLARATRGKNDELFYQALYQWSQCRLQFGILENNPSTIAAALREIENEENRNPELGGAGWKKKFDALKDQIRQHL